MSNENQPADCVCSRDQLLARFLSGIMPRELAGEFGLSEQRVRAELSAALREREEEILLEMEHASLLLHERLQRIEQAVWQEWERSQRRPPKRVVKEVRDAKGERVEITTTTEYVGGDPRYLALALRCLERRVTWRGLLGQRVAFNPATREDPQTALRGIIAEARTRQAAVQTRQHQAKDIERAMAMSSRPPMP